MICYSFLKTSLFFFFAVFPITEGTVKATAKVTEKLCTDTVMDILTNMVNLNTVTVMDMMDMVADTAVDIILMHMVRITDLVRLTDMARATFSWISDESNN